MKTPYLAPICAGLVGLTGLGFMGKGLVEDHYAHSFKTYPEVEKILNLQNERYPWSYELDQTKQISAREVLENKNYGYLLERIHNSELQEKELLRNPEIKTKYEDYRKSQSAMIDEAWEDMAKGFGFFILGSLSASLLLGRRKK